MTVLTVTSPRMLNQSGFLARLFQVFGRHRISVDLIATAEVSVSLTVEADVPAGALLEDLSAFANVGMARDRAIIAIVGEQPEVHARALARSCSRPWATSMWR